LVLAAIYLDSFPDFPLADDELDGTNPLHHLVAELILDP
jgi:hypothetical protein